MDKKDTVSTATDLIEEALRRIKMGEPECAVHRLLDAAGMIAEVTENRVLTTGRGYTLHGVRGEDGCSQDETCKKHCTRCGGDLKHYEWSDGFSMIPAFGCEKCDDN